METRIGIVEDDRDLRGSIAALLDGDPGLSVAFAVGTAEEALALLERDPPALLVVDLGLPAMGGAELIQRAAELCPGTEVLVLTVCEDDQSVFDALKAGAVGFLTKDAPLDRLLDAVHEAQAGGAPMSPAIARRVVRSFSGLRRGKEGSTELTTREQEVLTLVAEGYTYGNVAALLELSTHTVHAHLRNVYRKLAVNSRSEAVYEACRRRIIKLGS